MGELDEIDRRIDANRDEYIASLSELLAQPSVSATGEGVCECADLVSKLCRSYGFDETTIAETKGFPSVIARAFVDGTEDNDRPTIVVYGHYDVQPVDPSRWETDPFDPTVREDQGGQERIYARGAGDNKGQFFAHLCAIELLRLEAGGLPCNVTLLLEGEEESGSHNLRSVVSENADLLTGSVVYNADGPMEGGNRPEVNLGTRGLLSLCITARGPASDLHSGNHGGPVPNPVWGLAQLVASMKDSSGRVTIEGFYDDVRPVPEAGYQAITALPYTDETLLSRTGSKALADGPGDSYYEKLMYHPTLNINAIHAGYAGGRVKTIIPSEAEVKFDLRLVEDQDPDDIFRKIRTHVRGHGSDAFEWEVSRIGSMKPLRISLDAPFREPVVEAVKDVWNRNPVLKPSAGGAGPYAIFYEELDLPYIAVPYANSDENNHAPNENIMVENFLNGIKISIRVFTSLGNHFEE